MTEKRGIMGIQLCSFAVFFAVFFVSEENIYANFVHQSVLILIWITK